MSTNCNQTKEREELVVSEIVKVILAYVADGAYV